jgi:hypothetical protein
MSAQNGATTLFDYQVVILILTGAGIGQCGCMSIADTYMGGKTTNSGGCATSVVPPYSPWGNCWDHSEVVRKQTANGGVVFNV